MKQKIEWYREVLELEPGSRVFFPLAKLLAADGQASEAVFTLKQGLLRHPDHIEARLLLVELLHEQHAGSELQTEMDGLGTLFASYPGFWTAWSERLSATPALHDAALAMRFFAAALQGKKVSWAAIIEQGLQSVLNAGQEQQESRETRAAEESEHRVTYEDAPSAPAAFSLSSQPSFPLPMTETASSEPGIIAEEHTETPEEEEVEEVFSLRTRSMAEVLAEQGDIAGAIEIYNELLESASPDEKDSLAARIDELTPRLGVPQVEEGASEKAQPPGGESGRLISLLESLAQRVEARAR